MWTQDIAIALCKRMEPFLDTAGCHVALTGGLLYKDGERKDCDLLFYRIRQRERIDLEALFDVLCECGVEVLKGEGWVYKATSAFGDLDLFFPEEIKVIEDKSVPNFGRVHNVKTY